MNARRIHRDCRHPLLDCTCTCRIAAGACIACGRWVKHYRLLTERLKQWKAAPR